MTTPTLPPLPEFAAAFRPRWPGDIGGFTEVQMREYARAALAQPVPATPADMAIYQAIADNYTHPQPAPLTDSQIKAALTVAVQSGAVSWLGFEEDEDGRYTVPSLLPQHYQIARAIEAAHGIVPAPTTGEGQ